MGLKDYVFIADIFIILSAIVIAAFNYTKNWYYRSRLTHIIVVKWPTGYVEVGPNSRNWNGLINESRQMVFSADPNDHYRPWLEEHVGKQHRDWDWEIHINKLIIIFRRGKEEYAVQASLMWNN